MNQLKPKITKEIEKLQGYKMVWEIYNEDTDESASIDIDNDDVVWGGVGEGEKVRIDY